VAATTRHQVFICYSHHDVGYAHSTCRALEGADIRCWMAPRDISPSKDWAEEIIDAISSAAIMVLILSSSSNDSPQVRREVERAISKSVPVLPLRVEDVLLSKSLEYFISTQQWLDAFTPPFDMHLENLRICVLDVLRGPSTDGSPDREFSTTGAAAESAATASATARPTEFSPRDLKYIETQLATYLGPVAKFLVLQAARKSSSIEELTTMLSGELKEDGEQRSFRENCRFLEK
jgi:TIR domain